MLLVLTIIHKNFLVRGNRHIIGNPIYRSRIRGMNIYKYMYKTDLACLETTHTDRRAIIIFYGMLRNHGKLRRTKNMGIEDMVAIFLKILSHDDKNKMMTPLCTLWRNC